MKGAWTAVTLAAASVLLGASGAQAAECDRGCLGGMIWGGEIQAINAFFRILPLETPRFWPSAR